MKTHEVKTWKSLFERVKSGVKPFDVRQNDRDYQAGDVIVLKEFDNTKEVKTSEIVNYNAMSYAEKKAAEDKERFTGESLKFTIGYVLPLSQVPNMPGSFMNELVRGNYVVLSLLPPPEPVC